MYFVFEFYALIDELDCNPIDELDCNPFYFCLFFKYITIRKNALLEEWFVAGNGLWPGMVCGWEWFVAGNVLFREWFVGKWFVAGNGL